MEQAVIKKKKNISPIWILPLIAMIIGGWLLYKGINDAGIDIVVEFKTAEGITSGKTRVIYKGIPVGLVKEVQVAENLETVNVTIEMDRHTKEGLVEDTKFWVVKPVVSAGRISGLETLISGSYIALQKGISNKPATSFKGLSEPPSISKDAPGLRIKLEADKLRSIQKGSYIFYKNLVAGSVQDFKLEDSGKITIEAYIKPEFSHHINTETRFWNSSGITFQGDIAGFKLQFESLASLIYGGISFATPDNVINPSEVKSGHQFRLYSDFDAARYGINMTLLLNTADGIIENITKVMYRGVPVGTVKKITVDKENRNKIKAHILLDPDAKEILKKGTKFWVVRPMVSINRVDHLDTLIKGVYITFQKGEGEYEDTFSVQPPPNFTTTLQAGKKFTLLSEDSGSLSIGAPVMFRKFQVGEVTGFDLDKYGDKVVSSVLIYERYKDLVGKKAVFWNISGIDLKANLKGIKLRTDTLKSILSGGIAFFNPSKHKSKHEPAEEGKKFKLFSSYDQVIAEVPALKPKGLALKLRTSNLESITNNTPVLFKKVKVGEVTGFRLEEKGSDILVNILIDARYRHLVKTTSEFFNISGVEINGGLSGLQINTGSLESIIYGGISFITGKTGETVEQNHTFRLYESLEKMKEKNGIAVTIELPPSSSLTKGAEIKYLGVNVGNVLEIILTEGMTKVTAKAIINPSAKTLCREDSKLWIITSEVNLGGIQNLRNLVTGDYIEIEPGEGKECFNFKAVSGKDSLDKTQNGINIVLETKGLGSIKKTSRVFYRQMPVGRVTGFEIADDSNRVWIYANIKSHFAPLLRKNTKFWNVSGVYIDAGIFSGLQIDTESLETIVAGGIVFATPGKEKLAEQVSEGHHFKLYQKAEEEWLSWEAGISLSEDNN